MAEVTIPQQDAEVLAEPSVCAKTGLPTQDLTSERLVYTPNWIWILILFGFFPFFIAYLATRNVLDVELPITSELAQRRFRFRVNALLIGILTIGLAGLGAWQGWTPVLIVGIAGLFGLAALGPTMGARLWITARFDGYWVYLSRVHPNYASAIEAASSTS